MKTNIENSNIKNQEKGNLEMINSFIETHWKDIHHSRSQDWQYWLIILGIMAGIATLYKEAGVNAKAFIYVLVGIGGFVSIWASCISYSHWVLHIKKMCYIDYLESFAYKNGILNYHSFINKLEESIGEKEKMKDPFKVGGLIFTIHATISVLFIIASIIIISKNYIKSIINISEQKIALIPIFSMLISTLIFIIIYLIFNRCLKRKKCKYYKTIKKINPKMNDLVYKLHCKN